MLCQKFFTKTLDKANRKLYNHTKGGKEMKVIYAETNPGTLLGAEHFTGKEFKSKDGTEEFLYCPDLIETLEIIRKILKAPVVINSGYRTPEWNRKVGGAKCSYHMKGMAADITVKGHSTNEVAEIASRILGNHGGVIRYTNFVHIDVREEHYRKGVK